MPSPKGCRIVCADCLDFLPTLAAGSVDLVFTDPPYPCIKRSYGYWTEEEWFALMRRVVPECMRILKPRGSAVFVLQPNSERLGRMRTWLWEFMAWIGKEWGIVQDAYWWNHQAMPEAHAIQGRLMRPSLKSCVWVGPPDCYRNQEVVLQDPSERMKVRIRRFADKDTSERIEYPSGHGMEEARSAKTVAARGGVTPFNVLAMGYGYSQRSAGAHGHGAGTPAALCDWWIRYLCPAGGLVLDPFGGSFSTAVACIQTKRRFVGCELIEEYVAIGRRRAAEALRIAKRAAQVEAWNLEMFGPPKE
jgi:DNA modification methylase